MPGASPDDPGHERVDVSRARMAHPPAAHARRGVAITGYPGVGEKRGGGRAGDSRSPRERPRRSATEPAPAGRPRSPRPHHMLLYLSALGQRSGMHSACSRCDSHMKGFQPSRRDTPPDCLGDHGVRLPGSGRSGDWPARSAHPSRLTSPGLIIAELSLPDAGLAAVALPAALTAAFAAADVTHRLSPPSRHR
jgi:hypothetical protein